jgi:hypothetical protein
MLLPKMELPGAIPMKRLAVALFLFATTLSAQTAQPPLTAAPYTQLYVFGDSYSDSGSGYLDTNGPTAVAYLAEHLDISFTYYGDRRTVSAPVKINRATHLTRMTCTSVLSPPSA